MPPEDVTTLNITVLNLTPCKINLVGGSTAFLENGSVAKQENSVMIPQVCTWPIYMGCVLGCRFSPRNDSEQLAQCS